MNSLRELVETYALDEVGVIPEKIWDTLNPEESLVTAFFHGPSKSIKPPLYHEEVSKGLWQPVLHEYVPYVQCMIMIRYAKAYTYKEGMERLTKAGYNVTSQGQLSNIFNRVETRIGTKDKPRIDSVRTAKRQADGVPRRVSDDQRKHLTAARKIKAEKDALVRIAKEKAAITRRLAKTAAERGMTAAELRDTLASPDKPNKPVKPTESLDIPASISKRKILYKPTPKQAEFHGSSETIVLYGGAAGGGKSYGMLMDALRYCMHGDYRALIIRKSSPMLKELVGVSRTAYPKAFPGAKYNKQESVWYFPSGATIEFGYLDKPEDLERYQGLPYAYIGFDEIQHQRTPEGFEFLMSRLRSANPEITCYMRASANPGGAAWVKEYFIDPAEPDTTFWKSGISYKFIPARLEDNPYLDAVTEEGQPSAYRKMLMAMPEILRKQLLDGDWLVGDDQMFAFNPVIHVVSEDPPMHWNRIRGMDYGFRDPAATLWTAVSPENNLCVYDEHEAIEFTAEAWAQAVMTKEREDNGNLGIFAPMEEVIDWSLFKNVGHTGPSIREQICRIGMRPRPADRNREAGWNQIHTRLMVNPDTERPTITIHERCVKLIEQLSSARIHPKKPEEIDDSRVVSKGRKHHWDLTDALRYTCMARPSTMSFSDRSLKYKQGSMDVTWNKFGR